MDSQPDWLARTKFRAPELRDDLVSRPDLLEALFRAASTRSLMLLSAPPGYGKTTLLALLRPLLQEREGFSVGWLTLDDDDNDPGRFFSSLVGAVREAVPACEIPDRFPALDAANPAAAARRLIAHLINRLLECQPRLCLILDDLHLVTEPLVYAALDYLLERLPPGMHLVISSRYDPPVSLARLRAQGQLEEFRLDQLGFTLDEVARFLNGVLHLDLSSSDLSGLQARIEGWPAGLRLLAGSLDAAVPAVRASLIRDLAPSDRRIWDFLTEEMLMRQEPGLRTFLLETSILHELTPALCQAVTGRADSAAVLADLRRRNFFVSGLQSCECVLGQQCGVFRYHVIFAAFLRRVVAYEMPDRIPEIHGRAAAFYEALLPPRAISHYLAARRWEDAARVILQIGDDCIRRGSIESLASWIHSLPPEIVASRAELSCWLAIHYMHERDMPAAMQHFRKAQQGFELSGDSQGLGIVLAHQAHLAFLAADCEEHHALASRALACDVSEATRVQLLLDSAHLALRRSDARTARRGLQAAFQIAETHRHPPVFEAFLAGFWPAFLALPGTLDRIEKMLSWAGPSLSCAQDSTHVGIHMLWTFVHMQRGRFVQAISSGDRALHDAEQLAALPPWVYWSTVAARAAMKVALGQPVDLTPLADGLLCASDLDHGTVTGPTYLLARAFWLQRRPADARRLYMGVRDRQEEGPLGSVSLAMLEGILLLAERRTRLAVIRLSEAVSLEAELPFVNVLGSARILLAEALLEAGHQRDALAELARALTEGDRQRMPGRVLLEGAVATRLLELAAGQGVQESLVHGFLSLEHSPSRQATTGRRVLLPGTGEALTPREVEVLRMIASGANNRSIAEQLVISEHTVKAHITSIFGKLGVSSRTQAALRARQMHLS